MESPNNSESLLFGAVEKAKNLSPGVSAAVCAKIIELDSKLVGKELTIKEKQEIASILVEMSTEKNED